VDGYYFFTIEYVTKGKCLHNKKHNKVNWLTKSWLKRTKKHARFRGHVGSNNRFVNQAAAFLRAANPASTINPEENSTNAGGSGTPDGGKAEAK